MWTAVRGDIEEGFSRLKFTIVEKMCVTLFSVHYV